MSPEPVLIETPDELEKLSARLRRERVIAVDSEADSFFHYFDKLCLLQIGYKGGIALVDPLALPEQGLAPLAPILADPRILKIFHAADYDLYILQRYGKLVVRNIFDTMISAQLLGYRSVGLAALVDKHFDVKLSKDQQKTDWSRRPLRPAQIEYGASDVLYLAELAGLLEKELKGKKRLSWAKEEFALLEEKVWPERQFDEEGYLRIKGAKQLSARGLAVLRELFLMRDKRARALDRPPFKVLGNGTLLELAQHPARSKRTLQGRKGVTDLVVRRLGHEIIEATRRGMDGPEHPPREKRPSAGNGRRRLDRRAEGRLERLKAWRGKRAPELDLDPGVFASNALLEEIAAANPAGTDELKKLAPVKNWWAEEFGTEVLSSFEGAPEREAPRSGSRSRRARS
jgi:ribonuclease D